MNDHSELVKVARELADNIWCVGKKAVTDSPSMCVSTKKTLRDLADTVEAYDKRLKVQAVNDEAVAACKTCAAAIKKTLATADHVDRVMGLDTNEGRIELRAAGHIAKQAAKNADAVGQKETATSTHRLG